MANQEKNRPKKEYLESYLRLMNLAETLTRSAIRIRDMVDDLHAQIITDEPRPSIRSKKDFTDKYDLYVAAETQRDEVIDHAERVKQNIIWACHNLTKDEENVILKTYIDGWSWDQIRDDKSNMDGDGNAILTIETLMNKHGSAIGKMEFSEQS